MPRKTSFSRGRRCRPTPGFNEAAARCRGKLPPCAERPGPRLPASMRPRPDAAENEIRKAYDLSQRLGFNEAAARCRGKLLEGGQHPLQARRFNEAAARCRGKPGGRQRLDGHVVWLQ